MHNLLIKKLYDFLETPSVTLFEKPFYNLLLNECSFKNYNTVSHKDYLAFIPKKNPSNMVISAHMDRLGLVRTNGEILYSNYYGYKFYGVDYNPSLLPGNRFINQNVFAYDNVTGKTLKHGKVESCSISPENGELVFDVKGFHNKEMPTFFPIAYSNNLIEDKDELKGQLDNALSVALTYVLLKNNIRHTILLTTQEEIGKSWKFIYDFLEERQLKSVVTIDTINIDGIADFNTTDIVLRRSDDLADYDVSLVNKLINFADKNKFRYYVKPKNPKLIINVTEVGKLAKESNYKFNGATIQFPIINYHKANETVKKNCVKAVCSFALDFFQQI
ncbi:MAG: hypothetical protein HQ521_06350 [Bacteroidetes bacterium]|nr:hypothetical protein [Bacteroidota bacterium]